MPKPHRQRLDPTALAAPAVPAPTTRADRNAAALTPRTDAQADAQANARATQADAQAVRATEAPAPRRTPKASTSGPAPRTARATDTTRIGAYMTDETFNAARGAYLADWAREHRHDTFNYWVGGVVEQFAALTPERRAKHLQARGRADERTGKTRSFTVPADAAQTMREAMSADQAHGQYPTASSWLCDALAYATEASRRAAGGTLPVPPARLPVRLVR